MLTNETVQSASATSLLAGYATEDEVQAESAKSKRTLREWRQKRIGPPFILLGKTPYYPRDGFRAWLKSIEQAPRTRSGRAA